MKVNHLNSYGFTLLETLLVLSIFMLISFSTIYITNSQIEKREEKNFIRQLHLDLQQMQSLALAQSSYIYLEFYDEGRKYQVKNLNSTLFKRSLPKDISLSKNSYLSTIGFHPNGAVNQFGVFRFETKNSTKKVTVNIGHGRLSYDE